MFQLDNLSPKLTAQIVSNVHGNPKLSVVNNDSDENIHLRRPRYYFNYFKQTTEINNN